MTAMHNPPHPGRILRQWIEGRSVTEVAHHLEVSRVALSRVLNEHAGISAEMSLRLSDALGTSPDFWFKMQTQFDFWQASRKKRRKVPPLKNVA
jgi:addiction module HigA family antidote